MWIWLVVALLAAIGEVMTTGLFLATFAVAAVLTALIALVLPILAVQVAAFSVLSVLGVLFIRPFATHALHLDMLHHLSGPVTQSHLIGRRAVVTRPIDAGGGQIRIGQGEFWSAKPFDPAQEIAAGTRVEIVMVDGINALVEPVVPPAPEDSESSIATEKGR